MSLTQNGTSWHSRGDSTAATVGASSQWTRRWSKPDSNSRSHPLTRRRTHGSDRMNGAKRDSVVGSGSLVTLDPGATKREIARSFPVRPWALSQARGGTRRSERYSRHTRHTPYLNLEETSINP